MLGERDSNAEGDTQFVLFESNAILSYLADRHEWHDLCPPDARGRALQQQYLHWHHRSVREVSARLIAPLFRPDLGIPQAAIDEGREVLVPKALHTLEAGLLRGPYLTGPSLTLADVAK